MDCNSIDSDAPRFNENNFLGIGERRTIMHKGAFDISKVTKELIKYHKQGLLGIHYKDAVARMFKCTML